MNEKIVEKQNNPNDITRTCIVAIKDGNRIFMGADSQVSFGSGRQHPLAKPKVWQKDEALYGGTGDIRPIQVMEYNCVMPKPFETQKLYHFLVNNFVTVVRDTMRNAGCLHQHYPGLEWVGDSGVEFIDALFLIAYQKKIFLLSRNFSIIEYKEGYGATGSGEEFAYGVLKATEDLNIKPFERVIMALEAAAQFNYGVSGPFDVMCMEWKDDGTVIYYNEEDTKKL